MKRVPIQTTIALETKAGLQRIAKKQKLTDHGLPSKGRAIDYLVEKELKAGASNTGEA